MKYVVFEAGSRAGLSALMFFLHYRRVTGSNDVLVMVDSDSTFVKTIAGRYEHVFAMTERDWNELRLINDGKVADCVAFPADELTRQRGADCAREWWNRVERRFYNKRFVNEELTSVGISVPHTFSISSNVIIKPNTLSAGSKGIISADNVCVSERIDIEHEYVVDCFVFKGGDSFEIRAREVKLKNGYDKYIRLVPKEDKIYGYVENLLTSCPIALADMFYGVCHLQIAEDYYGMLFYIEGSKRISGTSLVLLPDGYNPFFNINDDDSYKGEGIQRDVWYSYEQLLINSWRVANGQ